VLYTIGAVDFVPFSWWWAWWYPKHVETLINTSYSASSWLFIHLHARYSSSVKIRVVVIFRRHRRSWEDNIQMDLQEVGYGGMDWIELARDRESWRALVNAVMNLRVP
jgi:hypothetical protein